jgi:hypothetical protein
VATSHASRVQLALGRHPNSAVTTDRSLHHIQHAFAVGVAGFGGHTTFENPKKDVTEIRGGTVSNFRREIGVCGPSYRLKDSKRWRWTSPKAIGIGGLMVATDAYSPELIELMSASFDAAFEQLDAEPSQALQLQFATRIMAAVNAGERDLDRLIAIALGEATHQFDAAVDPPSAPLSAEPSSVA